MKRLLITCSMFAFLTSLHAQTQSDAVYADKAMVKNYSNNYAESYASHLKRNEFNYTAIAVKDKHITFSGLPQEKTKAWAVVTNMDGDVIKEMRISPADTIMNIHRLHDGLYFVTIVYRNTNKKAFVIHL